MTGPAQFDRDLAIGALWQTRCSCCEGSEGRVVILLCEIVGYAQLRGGSKCLYPVDWTIDETQIEVHTSL